MADQGVENGNGAVDARVEGGVLRRVLAPVDLSFSDSLVEAWWRSLEHNRRFPLSRDSVPKVHRLVAFYVERYDAVVPHATSKGQMPDDMHFETGDGRPDRIAEARAPARAKRLEVNRARRCAVCAWAET
jgi:putative transposase